MSMSRALRVGIALLSLAGLAAAEEPSKPYAGEFIDVHCHVKPGVLTIPALEEALKKGGIKRAVVFLSVDAKAPRLPDGLIWFLHPPGSEDGPVYDAGTAKIFADALDSGNGKGMGELSLRHRAGKEVRGAAIPVDSPAVLAILDVAAKHGVPVNVHVEHEYADELARALAHNPKANVIWAHMGDAPPETVAKMLKDHPNCSVDVSCRHRLWKRGVPTEDQSITSDAGRLKKGWKDLFEAYPDRILWASDIGGGAKREEDIVKLVEIARAWLGELKPETAEAIGHGNAERLIGLK